MLSKDIAYNEPWRDAYREEQRQMTHALRQVLTTNNGLVSETEYARCFSAYPLTIKQKLFDVTPRGLAWKNKVQTLEKVAMKLGCLPTAVPFAITQLFADSRKIIARREFLHMVPTGATHFIRKEEFGQVYGFSLLVRPDVFFQGGAVSREDITLHKNKLIVFLHTALPLSDCIDTMYFRVMFYNDQTQPVRFSKLEAKLVALRQELIAPLRTNDRERFLRLVASAVNSYIHERQPRFREDNLSSHFFDRESILDQFE